MISDDQYRQDLERASAALTAWADGVRDVAEVRSDYEDGVWQIAMQPHAAGACSFEIGIRDDQCFDLAIADQFYEDQPVERFALFEDVARAIAEGHVIRRRFISAQTGAEAGVSMIVTLGAGVEWSQSSVAQQDILSRSGDLITQDQHFVPYRLSQ